jgi:C4-dicarboxylate-specific signal transduction histidine kinase
LVSGDRIQLQLLVNLVINAMDAMAKRLWRAELILRVLRFDDGRLRLPW